MRPEEYRNAIRLGQITNDTIIVISLANNIFKQIQFNPGQFQYDGRTDTLFIDERGANPAESYPLKYCYESTSPAVDVNLNKQQKKVDQADKKVQKEQDKKNQEQDLLDRGNAAKP